MATAVRMGMWQAFYGACVAAWWELSAKPSM
jgi:hypothetical protein